MLLAAAAEGRRIPIHQQETTAFNYHGGNKVAHRSARSGISQQARVSRSQMLFGLGKKKKQAAEEAAKKEAAAQPPAGDGLDQVDPDANQPEEDKDFESGDMADWKPDSPNVVSGKSTMSQDFQASDTPDFMPEEGSEEAELMAGVSFKDGMQGSQKAAGDTNKPAVTGNYDPNLLDSDPDVYEPTPEVLDAEKAGVEFVVPEFEPVQELSMFTMSGVEKEVYIDVKPFAMTYEDFFVGFTADSDKAFSVTPTSGKMERRGGDLTHLTVMCDPGPRLGELVGYLCFIPPEEKMFATYYKITCNARA